MRPVWYSTGKFQTAQEASWEDGDWNGDKFFDSGDLITGSQVGGFGSGTIYDASSSAVVVPEPLGLILMIVAGICALGRFRAK